MTYTVCFDTRYIIHGGPEGPCPDCGHPIGMHIGITAPATLPNGEKGAVFLGWGPPCT